MSVSEWNEILRKIIAIRLDSMNNYELEQALFYILAIHFDKEVSK